MIILNLTIPLIATKRDQRIIYTNPSHHALSSSITTDPTDYYLDRFFLAIKVLF